jgi:hypothetical protein
MKKFMFLIMIMLVSVFAFAQEPEVAKEATGVADFLKSYWLELLVGLMAFVKVIVNLTPTEKDNKVFAWIDNVFNAVFPNYKKGGGKF